MASMWSAAPRLSLGTQMERAMAYYGDFSPAVRRAIDAAADRYGVSRAAMYAIAQIESGGDPNARNPRSSARGLYQFMSYTGPEYQMPTERDRLDPAKSGMGAARMMAQNAKRLRDVLGREPTAGELYMAHQQGGGGAGDTSSPPWVWNSAPVTRTARNGGAQRVDQLGAGARGQPLHAPPPVARIADVAHQRERKAVRVVEPLQRRRRLARQRLDQAGVWLVVGLAHDVGREGRGVVRDARLPPRAAKAHPARASRGRRAADGRSRRPEGSVRAPGRPAAGAHRRRG